MKNLDNLIAYTLHYSHSASVSCLELQKWAQGMQKVLNEKIGRRQIQSGEQSIQPFDCWGKSLTMIPEYA